MKYNHFCQFFILNFQIGLTIAGMMCITMGYGFTIGMGALLGVKTGKLNDILALMLLGLFTFND